MSVETDRELLEFAAKAYGVRVKWEEVHGCYWVELGQGLPHEPWAPHEDDGQALRLAVKLRMSIYPPEGEGDGVAISTPDVDGEWIIEECTNDVYAAIRRAIFRTAAEIGRAMP